MKTKKACRISVEVHSESRIKNFQDDQSKTVAVTTVIEFALILFLY